MKRLLLLFVALMTLVSVDTGVASAQTAWAVIDEPFYDNGYTVDVTASVDLVDDPAGVTYSLAAVCVATAEQDVDETGIACYMKDEAGVAYYFAAGNWSADPADPADTADPDPADRVVTVGKVISVPRGHAYRLCVRAGYRPLGGIRVAWMAGNREYCTQPRL